MQRFEDAESECGTLVKVRYVSTIAAMFFRTANYLDRLFSGQCYQSFVHYNMISSTTFSFNKITAVPMICCHILRLEELE